jgi:alpha-galactosidase
MLACSVAPYARVSDTQAEFLDAYVERDAVTGEWAIGNGGIRYAIAVGRDRSLRLIGLTTDGWLEPVTRRAEPDAVVTIGDQAMRLGDASGGFLVERISAASGSHFVSLSVRLVSARWELAATRHYVVYPRAAAVEMWTTFETLDGAIRAVQNLNAYDLNIPFGKVEYVSGLQAPDSEGGAFTRRERFLADGEYFELGSPTLSSEATVPYFTVGDGRQRVFSGLVWSGAWVAAMQRDGGALWVSFGMPHMSAFVRHNEPLEGPHAFIGATWDTPGSEIAPLTDFIRQSRAGRAFHAWTTFNTWFVHGINIDESLIRREMEVAAEAGVELFQVDAGWYPRSEPKHAYDFTNGLGSWEVDAARFPSGLAALREQAHDLGLRFGLWVEPERVALSTVGAPDLAQESFLATQDGAYDPGLAAEETPDAQICLAFPAARAWVQQRLFALLDEVRPDNLKWDFNRWVHCTRPDHGHPVNGGNYAHTRALYELLAAVRARYPDMTIENCSGGGHRVDFAMARLTDTAWMDDRSAPSARVRHNLNGLLQAFPAPYLFSYVMGDVEEPMRDAVDMPMLVRSRMPGVVGVATDFWQLGEREFNELHQQLDLARRLRPLQMNAITHALTPQRSFSGEWEVIQQVTDTGTMLVFAYSAAASDPITVQLRSVRPEAVYEIRSADHGVLGRVGGWDLIVNGLEIAPAPETAAQVLVLEPVGGGVASRQSRSTRRFK